MGRICFSLKKVSREYAAFMVGTRKKSAIELRLDECDFSDDDIRFILGGLRKAEVIATCHISLPSQVEEAAKKLTSAILAGVD